MLQGPKESTQSSLCSYFTTEVGHYLNMNVDAHHFGALYFGYLLFPSKYNSPLFFIR